MYSIIDIKMARAAKYTLRRLLAVMLFFVICTGVSAQVMGDQYTTTYDGTTVTNVSITHKSPKWTQYHEGRGYNDTYNETDMITLENGTAQVQAANAYVDTIYVHKGTSVTLTLPYRVADSNASIYNYLRWFDYRTDGNFYCNSTSIVSGSTVYDLLTPALSDRTTYRFANGYATLNGSDGSASMTKMNFYYPTDDEYSTINSTNFKQPDNDYYIVACDASIYTDFAANNNGTAATFGSTNNWCEPTLAGRAIYYIIGVEDDEAHEPAAFTHYWELQNSVYQGGTNTGAEHYLDEYEITYPSRRLSNNTAEMVALNKDANAYAIPGTNPSLDSGELDVTLIDDASLGFNLTFAQTYEGSTDGSRDVIPTGYGKSGKISGNDRIIFFYKGDLGGLSSTTAKTTVPTDTQWYVANGSTITILVTKTIGNTIYNLARYKVTFEDDANLLTQTQVAGLSSLTGNEDYWWNNMTHRSPQYMEETYSQVASLLFDYDESVDAKTVLPNGQEHFYPFPMDWSSNGYAFYDGVTSDDANTTFDSWNSGELSVGTRFSMYSITNEYIGYWDSPNRTGYASPPTNLVKDDSGYWLYIDASERPGTVAEITIDGNLCEGSKLYGTAWIKGAGGANSVDAGALFSIGGVTVNADGTETHNPILRQATGQVRVTTRITEDNVNEPGLSSSITGKGADTNEWFQVYFSLMNDGSQNFDYYTLRVDNYCAGTDGGDYYFDELRVYVETPTAEVQQLLPICTDGDSLSYVRFDLDYETLLSRMGIDPSDYDTGSTASVDIVIINRAKYYNGLAAGEEVEDAFKAALITFYDSEYNPHQLPTLDFYINYDENQQYDTDNPGGNIVNFNNDDEGFLFRRLNGTIQELSMDCYTDMMAFTDYILLAEPHTEAEKSETQKIDEFIQLLDDECAIRTNIFLSSTISLKVNGQLAEPLQEYCAGQVLHISPDLTYTDEDTGEELYFDGIYYDWFYGSKEEYTAENENFEGETLQYALRCFRYFYPDAEELDSTHTPPTDDGYVYFTQNQYNLIEYYLTAPRTDGGEGTMLVLHSLYLDVRMLSTGLEIVIQPIRVELTDENGQPIDVCFGYCPLTLMSGGEAPTLRAGFSNINYPNADFEPCLRLGLAQLEKCSEDMPFIVNLCDATYAADDVDHLGVAGNGLEKLFLIDTDDPYYHEMINEPDFDQYSIPVGKIAHLYATEENESDDESIVGSYMKIYFYKESSATDADDYYLQFIAKEGYYYAFEVNFEEYNQDGESVGNVCEGVFPLEVKIVPEYLVWTGDKTENWNNDNHWERVSATRINGTKDESSPYFTDGNNTNTNGFVPMLFTKVIIPRGSEAELYMAGFEEGSDGMLSWVGDEEKEGGTPTTDHEDVDEYPSPLEIMYDMMLYDTEDAQGNLVSMKTEHYRVNLCDQIHFEPGAQLLHSEQLIYNKAWTDVEISQGPWTLAATPLRDVASGDWYTKKSTGTETAEYFTDIEFDSNCDRVSPMVYQRSWSNSGNQIIYNSGTDKTVPAYASTGWSSVYNDVSVAQQAGEGFSIKASNGGEEKLMFRFPKADVSYQYQVGTSSTMTDATTTISRENAGRLLISSLVNRTNPDGDDDDVYTGEVTVDLTQTGNNYYIIGNPYTAPMSMAKFMKENEDIKGYWLESTYGPIVGTGETNSWGTVDCLIEPYSAFFVTTDENDISPLADNSVTVTFTKDMQTFEVEEEVEKTSLVAFSIRASNDVGTTGATISYSKEAIDGYNISEDAVLMQDASWKKDGMPLVYTVADDMAVSVNKLNALTLVPLGCFADDDLEYTLTFVGVENLNEPSLYDAYTNTDTPLTEGYTLEMTGESHGRYFIRSKGPSVTGIEEIVEDVVYSMSAYSPTTRTIIVSSEAGIDNIEVYSLGGILLSKASVGGNITCTLDGIESGIAIVRARTSAGTFVKKIRVR